MLQKIIYIILGFSIAFVFMPKNAKDYRGNIRPSILGTNTENIPLIHPSPELASALTPPKLSAKAAYAFDLTSGSILFTHNFDEKLPIASLTKLMTALLVVEMSRDLDEAAEIQPSDTAVMGSNMGLVRGEKITTRNLLAGMLVSSANDATLALARTAGGTVDAFIDRMNQKARILGLFNTRYSNPVGWDTGENYSTALDLSVLVREFLKHETLAQLSKTKELKSSSIDGHVEHILTTTNKLLLEDQRITGVKTGFTSEAKGNLIAKVTVADQEVLTIVLGSDDREGDTRNLIDWIFSVYRW